MNCECTAAMLPGLLLINVKEWH